MNDADSKKLEEIDNTIIPIDTINKMIRLLDAQRRWLIPKVKEQDREIERLSNTREAMNAQVLRWEKLYEYQRRRRKWALEQCRIWQRHFCFYKDDAVRFHSARADKAEAYNEVLKGQRMDIYNEGAEDGKMEAVADLRNLTPGGSEFQTIDECIKWIRDRLSTRAKQATDNRRLQERVRELEDLRYQSFRETRKHCDKWQQDRMELMQNLPGYKYKNRVDDPEWEKAKKILLSLLAETEKR